MVLLWLEGVCQGAATTPGLRARSSGRRGLGVPRIRETFNFTRIIEKIFEGTSDIRQILL
ncbi:hypothetical protein E2C01_069176 [Portunus trituberculatus]|uniref:Uncharacterized protein n=1 Tax=Portunus trituberculatus TaxID=210409 RepID=A0A5B7HPE2_PORTR|nr:hypothetical protein [Portunus trituberculatus]